jgi:hypothetical protein
MPARRPHFRHRTVLSLVTVAAVSAGLVGIAAPAQAAPASSSISITGVKSSSGSAVVKGGKLTLSGKTSTSLRKRTLEVSLTRGRKTSALGVTTRVSAASRFSVTIPVNTSAGTAKYVLRFPGTSTVKSASASKSVTVSEWFSLGGQEVTNSGEDWGWSHPYAKSSESIGGKVYTNVVTTQYLGKSRQAWAEWNLGYHCSTLSTSIGLVDSSSSGGVIRSTISTDGTARDVRDVRLGAVTSTTISLTGAFRLRIDAQSVAQPEANVGYPYAKLLCTSNPNPKS